MDVPTVTVTGSAGLIGQSLLPRLAVDRRVLALDVREPARRVRGTEVRLVDVARSDLVPVLEGTEVLVHLAAVVDPLPDEALMARVNVHGTRRVLEAAAAVGVRKVVRVSGTTVYGAWPGNPLPLREDHPLRPNPGFSPAVHAVEAERLLVAWGEDDPRRVVTTLRTAPVLGPGAERLPSRLVLGRPRLRVRGATAPVQAVHVDDLVDALELVIRDDHPGAFNVAADGWLDPGAVLALVPGPRAPAVPRDVLARTLRWSWTVGIGDIPPTVVPYLVHPWVVSNERMRALGWSPRWSNEDAIRAGLAARPSSRRRTLRREPAARAR
jgi:nucleoside-diphosphate-sugar epimerase